MSPQRGYIPEWRSEPGYGQQHLYDGRADYTRGTPGYGPPGYGLPSHQGGRRPGSMRRYAGPQRPSGQRSQVPGQGPAGPALLDQLPGAPPARKVRFRRRRKFFRRRSVRIATAVMALFLVLVMFSAGQAAFRDNGQGVPANLAEWARDHYLGPVVTFGEWLSYNPPPKGGKPSFSLAVPSGEAVSPTSGTGIPATLESLAGSPVAGEGQWRVVEKVSGEPAILTTFLRDATYTSQVNGIASIDQRLVRFSLRPGTEDPGTSQDWGVPAYIPARANFRSTAAF